MRREEFISGVFALALIGPDALADFLEANVADPALAIFKDKYLANLEQAKNVRYKDWQRSSPLDYDRWISFRDAVLAGEQAVVPEMSTPFGRMLVAAGEMHMSISRLTGSPEPAPGPVPPPPSATGDRYASPDGSDSNPGTLEAPFATFRKLANALAPGQTGMLRAGAYGSASTYHALSSSGSLSNPITITNYPGERVTIKGYIDVLGNYVTVKNLHIDGSNSALNAADKCGVQALGITVKGSDVIFEYCDVYHSGNKGSGFVTQGDRLTIRYCKIHDIGYCFAYDHGAYIGDGDGVQMYGNWIWNNPHGFGIQVYPSPTNGRFHSNVIDACGSGFAIADETGTCIGNTVYNNVIANCVGVMGQGGWYDVGGGVTGAGPSGAGNVFRDNCCFNNVGGAGGVPNVALSGNIVADPLFVDAANHDYRLRPGSPCVGYGLPDFVVGPSV